MGLLANLAAVISLIILWRSPLPPGWWIMLALMLADWLLLKVLRESLRLYGPSSRVTIFWGIICTIIQLAQVVLGAMVIYQRIRS